MQKKIYPLFLVPCSLALCLALIFLMSCGGGGSNPDTNDSSSSSGFTEPPCEGNCDDPRVSIADIDTSFNNWKLIVKGVVGLNGGNQTVISKIEINLRNVETNAITPIPFTLNSPIESGESYSLRDGQGSGLEWGSSACELNKGTYQVYVYVYLKAPDKDAFMAKKDSLPYSRFKKTHEGCKEYTLTTTVSPSPAASACQITRTPEGPYSQNQQVTLTAPQTCGKYAFFNWTDGGDGIAGNSYNVRLDDGKSITANFVESYNLAKDNNASKEYKAGDLINLGGGSVQFTGTSFVAQGNARIINSFKLPGEYAINDSRNKQELTQEDRDPSSSLKTSQFVTADNSEETEIDHQNEYYFVVTTGSGPSNWFLLLPNNDGYCTVAANPKCTKVTIWKAQQ